MLVNILPVCNIRRYLSHVSYCGAALLLLGLAAGNICIANETSHLNEYSGEHGFLRVQVESDTVFLYLNERYNDVIILTGDKTIEVEPGRYTVIVFGKSFPETRATVQIEGGDYHDLFIRIPSTIKNHREAFSTYARYRSNANLLIITDEETSITVTETNQTAFGTLMTNLRPGVYRIKLQHIKGYTEDRYAHVNAYQLTTVESYLQPQRGTARRLSLIPGGSQIYKKQYTRGTTFLALTGLGVGTAMVYDQLMKHEKKEFDRIYPQYYDAENERIAYMVGSQLERIASRVDRYESNRNLLLIGAAIVYIINIIDAFMEPNIGFGRPGSFDPYRDVSIEFNRGSVGANISFQL
jgi:hypothetical protein